MFYVLKSFGKTLIENRDGYSSLKQAEYEYEYFSIGLAGELADKNKTKILREGEGKT
jgi:hypothetical protein